MISIVVPAFNAEATLGACLDALLGQTGLAEPCEVIVVDDGSTDGTAELARRYPPPVRLVAQPHRGAAAARNRGAVAAEGALLLFTDADCRPRPDWAAAMVRALARPGVAGVKGLFRSDQTALIARLVQAEYEEKEAQMLARPRVAFADTAAAGYRADVFRAVGGFRTDMQAVEDTELAFRLVAAGHTLVVAPDAVVYHAHPERLWPYARRKLRYGLWGAQAYLAHPERLTDDSRTPWSMRAQLALAPLALMALAGASLAALFGVPSAPRLGLAAAGLCGIFVATVLPFSWRARGRGPGVVLAAPVLFGVRALALDAGLAVGLVRRFTRAGPAAPPAALQPLPPLPPGGTESLRMRSDG
jgi:cellulose synthase/poly-beta-1,6-N-acetylglucosamine synthase-like glycosyltransferase